MSRCEHCDHVLATDADEALCPDGCTCERCTSLFWYAWNMRCSHPAVDWRARYLALRAAGEAMAERVDAARDATRQALGACGYADACDDELDALDAALARWREVAK